MTEYSDTATVPDRLQGPGLGRRLLERLGIVKRSREDHKPVSTHGTPSGGGNGLVQVTANGGGPSAVTGTDKLLKAELTRQSERSLYEAGTSKGHTVPELVLGAQRYPEPSAWDPETEGPMMEDEGYLDTLKILGQLGDRKSNA